MFDAEVTGRITVVIDLAPQEIELPFDPDSENRETWMADIYDQWYHAKDYILGSSANDITVDVEVVEIDTNPDFLAEEAEILRMEMEDE
tara:strand:+ start:46 stop:312 length:267 start_codon:yes stop_codon:yes gene_type:complete